MEDNTRPQEEISSHIQGGEKQFMPQLSINSVIFGFTGERLVVLATQPPMAEIWVIPGEFVYQTESIDEAAHRSLRQQLGIDEIFLRQFRTFGEADRSFAGQMVDYFEKAGVDKSKYGWLTKRFVTIGYYACADFRKIEPQPSSLFEDIRWIDIDEIDLLAMDHANIVREARAVLTRDLLDLPVIASLLPDTFTIPELQKLHEAILGRAIDRGNFRQKVLRTNILEKVGERNTANTRRPPGLYRFNRNRYRELLEEEVKIGF
ncbi:NUDIX hydrolase [Flavilitoribacter nigricans]|uniref:NUDIX hydrolase n=1 Tax=Flavilitoribacter nigricans (strain ATCC 23147 / DSM 23189 / NBRC 102662 / NCIMB 1420 / SS-2) TaxID=1122177 RepID=A0A2D0NCP2_FLAN2|nr:NUDIX domain-containing protein [Flavilitoribacter nigricans]PHN05949.1 NUDIX hydrolase [Flavilitoribacter nigricans DSM 23189 = NBRC 102662]